MRYIVTGGGTGGHIYPALAIIMELKKQDNNAEILYVGTKNGMESDLVPKEGIDFKTVRVKGMPRSLNKESFIATKELIHGIFDSRKILKEFKPDIVIGTGGYVCAPMVLVAALKKIPTVIHEQNVFPGITNKLLSRFVDKILITFEESKKYFKNKDRIILTGNPIRDTLFNVDIENAYREFELDNTKKTILSFGGSNGQKKLNDSMYYFIKNALDSDIQIVHVTGKRFFDDFMKKLIQDNLMLNENIKIMPYLYNMPSMLNITDLIITSAGAITLSEISALGIPSILIPKANTAENHQEYNARVFSDRGAGELILENELTGELLYNTILEIINDNERLEKMAVETKKLGNSNSVKEIVNIINETINNAH